MKLGLLTAPFPRRSLKQVATWAASEGFEMLEVACWPAAGGERRRYAGTSHIDVSRARRRRGSRRARSLRARDLVARVLPEQPAPRSRRAASREHASQKVIDAAAKLDVGIVGTFVGRDKTKNVPDNFREFRKVWPRLVDYAESRGVKIAIENCPMIFSWDEWPGGTNLASSPAHWDEMFSIVDSPSFGLNLDPSHLVWLMIDYERVVRDYASKIFHVHAKDMEIDRDGLYRNGTASLGMGWQVPRLPGLGEVRWDRFIAALYREGYDFVVSVEHEDRAFEGTEELVKRGFLIARDALQPSCTRRRCASLPGSRSVVVMNPGGPDRRQCTIAKRRSERCVSWSSSSSAWTASCRRRAGLTRTPTAASHTAAGRIRSSIRTSWEAPSPTRSTTAGALRRPSRVAARGRGVARTSRRSVRWTG